MMYLDDSLTEDELREAVIAEKMVELPEKDRKAILTALDNVDTSKLGA